MNGVQIAIGGSDVNNAAGDYRRGKNCSDGMHLADAHDHIVIKIRREDRFVVGSTVLLCEHRQILARGLRLEGPESFSRAEIDRGEYAILSRKIEHVASNRR